jgi:uncharacterized membrane protein YfcA
VLKNSRGQRPALLPSVRSKRQSILAARVHQLLVFGSAFGAGMINSVAGGGTLLSFPALIWLGVPSIAANATSTVALWPGSLGSVWGYRRELRDAERSLWALAVPSLAGGLLGAFLLSRTPAEIFDRLVPLLIFFATCLLAAQEAIQRRFDLSAIHTNARSPWLSWAMVFQAGVGVYGGYFGAGIGILMLAALSLMGHTDIHQMNAVKNVLAVCINGIAAAYFVASGLVIWQDAAVMAAGAVLGGVGGPSLARRMGRVAVRRVIVAIGFGMAAALLVRAL